MVRLLFVGIHNHTGEGYGRHHWNYLIEDYLSFSSATPLAHIECRRQKAHLFYSMVQSRKACCKEHNSGYFEQLRGLKHKESQIQPTVCAVYWRLKIWQQGHYPRHHIGYPGKPTHKPRTEHITAEEYSCR